MSSNDEGKTGGPGPYRVAAGAVPAKDPDTLPAHQFDVPTSGEPFPYVDPRGWVWNEEREKWKGCFRTPVRIHVWLPGKPMTVADAVKRQGVMGYDFTAEGPQKSAWFGSTHGEAYDLFQHAAAREELRAGPIVVPGALVSVRGKPSHVLMFWMREDGHLAYEFRSYDDVYSDRMRYLFTQAVRE